jgi:hypothetical protein
MLSEDVAMGFGPALDRLGWDHAQVDGDLLWNWPK